MKYEDFLEELYSLQDLKYKEFHGKLIMNAYVYNGFEYEFKE